ncbi:FAD-dependent oxidoreductase [Paenibacillus roseipurpureus]|uniref:FAD-dependent oxidoreductase n=1 Tax=Paenibacillus roseopurpureus TaxID=2918901 RepID=A0AA96LPL9_9BACL|nr:FAD-dependent oxidoreductase [Paenibacillus sp. MBLB1832]WNR43498.1 FAD-dependent oxidoreductase [Paenibacillus sp. MBLB1832]
MITYHKQVSTIEVDVLVCGSGSAGVGAAIAAAKNGASTLVLEKNGYSGGIITAVHNPFFDGLVDLRTKEVICKGIAFDLYTRMGYARLTDTHMPDIHQTVDPELFKLTVDRMYKQYGVKVWYHSPVIDVVTEGSRIKAVLTANKGGVYAIVPKVVIDTTGDADVAAWGGAPFEISSTPQPMTLHFRIGNVQVTEDLDEKCGEVLKRHLTGDALRTYGGPWFFSLAPDEITINATRIIRPALDPEQKSMGETEGREDAWRMFELWKQELPEFKNAYFISSGPEIGVRETRRIVGDYTITLDDIIKCHTFDDAIVKGSWFVDIHPSDGSVGVHPHRNFVPVPYDIPYRTMIPQKLENVLVAGRCHSATREALGSTRVTITAMGMGEAAGIAARMAIQSGKPMQQIDVAKLQGILAIQEVQQKQAI